MQFIESRRNKMIREILSLKDKKNRRKLHKFFVEGLRFVKEALSSGAKVEKLCFSAGAAEKYARELGDFLTLEIQCFEIPPELFGELAETESPQGIGAVVRIPAFSLHSLYRSGFRGLILDCIQDPGNAGTMIRSAHALGFDAVVATKGTVDLFNGKVLRSTMGSVFHIPVIENCPGEEILAFCEEHRLRLLISRLEDAKPCHEADLTGEFMLAVGNEGNGVSEYMQCRASGSIRIPMPGGAESLNAAAAASILMYESNRQRD